MARKKNSARKGKRSMVRPNTDAMFRSVPQVMSNTMSAMIRPITRRASSIPGGSIISGGEKFCSMAPFVSAGGGFVTFNPADPGLIQLSREIVTYSKYRVLSLRFRYVSQLPSSTGGIVTFGWFGDVNDANSWYTGAGSDGPLATTMKAKALPIWSSDPALMSLTSSEMAPILNWFPVGSSTGSTQFTSPGAFAYYYGFASTQAVATRPGVVYVDYELEVVQSTPGSYNVSLPFKVEGVQDIPIRNPPDTPDPPPSN